MRLLLVVLVLCLVACGRSLPDDAPVESRVAPAAGAMAPASADAGPVAQPDAGSAGTNRWCAPAAGSCLANGWDFEVPGRCCLSRMTCKGRDAGGPGFCAY